VGAFAVGGEEAEEAGEECGKGAVESHNLLKVQQHRWIVHPKSVSIMGLASAYSLRGRAG